MGWMIRLCGVLSLYLLVAGCSGDSSAEESHGGEGGPDPGGDAATAAAPSVPQDPTTKAVHESLQGAFWRGELEAHLDRWKGSRQPMTDLLRATYEQRGYRPVFLDGLAPNEAAAAVIRATREVPSHGLPHSPYRPKALIPLYESLALDPAAAEGTLTEPAYDNERLAELEWQLPRTVYKRPRTSELVPEVRYRPIKELPELPALGAPERCLLEAVTESALTGRDVDGAAAAARCKAGEGAMAAIREALDQRRRHKTDLALLDAMLLQAFYQWVLDFSIDRRVHPFESNGTRNRERLPADRRDDLLAAFATAQKQLPGGLDEVLRGYVPGQPDYQHARAALARYAKLLEADQPAELRGRGWLKKGESGDAVRALQKRLALEGYFEDEVSGEFDEATHEAVVRYQETHSLAPGGVVGPETVESLNVPFEWRAKQLIASLGTFRESELHRRGEPELYIRVNLPAYELRVVERGKVIRRHKVIVGSNQNVEDPLNDNVVWHQRRTKLFDTVVNEVVLNPTWIVPQLIVLEEIQPKIREIPNYLEDNNFRKVGDLLVQGPAESNPLGVVKFSLESTDSIYLHDTDKRWLFKELGRSLSHGCIRVDEPVELAKFVLGRQGVEASRIDARIEEGTTLPIKLERPIPIFIEYNTVGSTDEGEPLFYPDIYAYDVAYWKKRTPITRRFP